MRRMVIMAALLTPLLVTVPGAARAADVGVSIRIGDRYSGSELTFTNQPRMVVIPRTSVYYIQDYDVDVYRVGRFYYAYDRGRWWRARHYRGPWIYIRARQVPRPIYAVPADYRRNWRGDYDQWRDRDYDENWQRDWGHGNRGRDMNRGQEMNRGRDVNRGQEMNRGRDMDRGPNQADNGKHKGQYKDKDKNKDKDKSKDKGHQDNRGY